MEPFTLTNRASCPACRASGRQLLLDLPYDGDPIAAYLLGFYGGAVDPGRLTGQRYRLVACTDCGLLYQETIAAEPLLEELYGRGVADVADAVRRARGLSVRQAYANDVEQLIKYHGLAPHELRVLDYGAGAGAWIRMADAYGCHVSAAEFSDA